VRLARLFLCTVLLLNFPSDSRTSSPPGLADAFPYHIIPRIAIEDHRNDDLKIIQAFLAKEEKPIDDLKIVWEQRCILSGCFGNSSICCFSAFWLCVVGSGGFWTFIVNKQVVCHLQGCNRLLIQLLKDWGSALNKTLKNRLELLT